LIGHAPQTERGPRQPRRRAVPDRADCREGGGRSVPRRHAVPVSGGVEPLRCISYLAPSLPYELFQVLTDYLADSLQTAVSIEYETRSSAPRPGANPFALGEADLGFVCSTALA